MTTTPRTTIEIPIDDFFRKDNAALVRLLKEVAKNMPQGIATRKLCEVTFDSRSYGLRIIERAERDGYITRTGEHTTTGGGLPRICKITKKGRNLLRQLEK